METENNLNVRIIFNEEMRPDCFFVRSPQQNLSFDAMDSSLQNHFRNPHMNGFDGNSPRFQNTHDVMVCFVEDRYFRCNFLGIEQNQPKVFLIDVGRILKVPFDSCYGIPLRFAHSKPYALRCHLNIVPKDEDVWTAENGTNFFKNICYKRQLSCGMVFRKEHPVILEGWKSFCVDLIWNELKMDGPFSRESKITCFMSQQLVSQNFANAPTIEGIEDMFEQLDFTEDTEESCPEKNELSQEEEIKTTPVKKWPASEVPLGPQDDYVQIRVTHIDEYGQIYYHLYEERQKLRQMRSTFREIYSIEDATSFYNEVHKEWKAGDACVIIYEDNFWYRARIVNCNSDGYYLVVLIDRGNDYLVDSFKKIRTPYHFGEVPALANRVVLQNVVPKKENSQPFEWEKEVLDKLYTYIFYQNNWYDIRIKYAEEAVHDLPIKVTMVHKIKEDMTDKKKSVDIGKRMAILGEASITEFDTRIYKERYDTWGMTAVVSQKNLKLSESGDSDKRTEREMDNLEIDNLLLLSASRDLKI